MSRMTGKYAAIFRPSGSTTSKTTMPLGTADGANDNFVLGETINDCEATTGWTGTVIATDAVDYKEGAKSVKDTIPAAVAIYITTYTFTANIDATHRRYFSIWFKSTVANANFVITRARIYDSAGNYNYFTLTFSANTWKRFDFDLRNPDGSSGTVDYTDLDKIDFYFDDLTGAGEVFRYDWLTKNPQLVENVVVYDNAAVVDIQDYDVSPSGYITFETAPTATHAITADYDYYATIEQIAGAYNWSGEESADLQEDTAFDSDGHKHYVAGNDGWTITAEKHWESGYLFNSGTTYLMRFYVYLDETTPVYYEGVGICERATITVPQETLVNESITFKGNDLLYYITEV